nr:dnaj like subfamily b member 12 [Quercus suber]
MAPTRATEDYYLILDVEQTASSDDIRKAYRRLALKLHPDRNTREDSTKAFQLLGLAYETLIPACERREYDLIYPSLKRSRANPQSSQTPRAPPASAAQSEALREAVQITAIRKRKEESTTRWNIRRSALEASIFELQRTIRRVEQEIKNLASIAAAEAAEQARKNSWGTWLLSPLYKTVEESEDDKTLKDRHRQERKIERDLKERRLGVQRTCLQDEERDLEQARQDNEDVSRRCDQDLQVIQARAQERENRARWERERVEAERLAKIRKEQQERAERAAQEAREALRKEQAARDAERARQWERERVERERVARILHEKREQQMRNAQKVREDLAERLAKARAAESAKQQANRRRQRNTAPYDHDEGITAAAYAVHCSHGGW